MIWVGNPDASSVLTIGYWLLAIGYWLLAIGYCWLRGQWCSLVPAPSACLVSPIISHRSVAIAANWLYCLIQRRSSSRALARVLSVI
ncbi:hypothetical protein ELS78_19280 [Aeromonas veronii]|nr:hypothetical protein ELS78_19280 [Aeromonas veronii]